MRIQTLHTSKTLKRNLPTVTNKLQLTGKVVKFLRKQLNRIDIKQHFLTLCDQFCFFSRYYSGFREKWHLDTICCCTIKKTEDLKLKKIYGSSQLANLNLLVSNSIGSNWVWKLGPGLVTY